MKFNCDSQNSLSWQIRAEKAVDFLNEIIINPIDNNQSLKVGDFGCGNERLKVILQQKTAIPFEYYGFDLEPQIKTTHRINLDQEMPSSYFDFVFCLGLLEYLQSVDSFLSRLAKICKFAIISYVVSDSGIYTLKDTKKMGWLHHYSIDNLEALLKKNDFSIVNFELINNKKTGLWLLKQQ
jgi:hypothetical protein